MSKKSTKKIVVGLGIICIVLLIIFLNREEILNSTPTLTIETPQKISASESKEFTLDVKVSTFGEAIYPATSMSISFDAARLEFLGVEDGNVFIRNDEEQVPAKLPEWSCNPEHCNETGKINIIYLDTTGGKNAFSKNLLGESDNVILRLNFRLRGSARKGDVCDLIFDDAVFAASNEKESLAMTRDTLKVRNGKIVIGE